MVIGRVREIWRYPVKSMGGELLDQCAVGPGGISGDRGWALRDEESGEIRGAKQLRGLMECSASYREQPSKDRIANVDIFLPDGTQIGSDNPKVNSRLSEFVGRNVSLWPLQPAANKAHYRRSQPGGSILRRLSRFRLFRSHIGTILRYAGLEKHAREIFSREPDEPIPDFSNIPPDLFEFTSPPGTYFDLSPIHLLTTSSLNTMKRTNAAADWDVRRFRPNFLIETVKEIEGLVEAEWPGHTLQLGGLQLRCDIPTVRCGMTMQAQRNLPKDPSILRTIVRDAFQNLGLYATPENSSEVDTGDSVILV